MPDVRGYYELLELQWPVTFNWTMSVPWGFARMALTVEAPTLVNDPMATAHAVNQLWTAAIAPAISFLTTLVDGGAYLWKLGWSTSRDGTFPVGMNGIFPAGPSHGVAVVMHSGHTDRAARRRLIFPTCPRAWIDDHGQLEHDGAGKMLTHLRGMFAGLNGTIENAPMAWLLPNPTAFHDPITGFGRVGFRSVEHLRLCSYTVPVPDIDAL